MDTTKIIDIASKVSLAGLLIAVLYLGSTGVWVWGGSLKEEQARTAAALAERDKWMNLAIQGTNLAERAATKVGVPHMVGASLESKNTPEETQNKLNSINSALEKLK